MKSKTFLSAFWRLHPCAMSAGEIDVVDGRHPELAVCGYVRQNYRHSIPVAIVNLMESFYSLWIKKRVSGEQLQILKEQLETLKEKGLWQYTDIALHFHSLLMKGFRIEVVLKASWNNINDEVMLWLAMNLSPEIDFMAGNLAVAYDGNHSARSHWVRSTGRHWERTDDAKFLRESDLKNLNDLSIAACIDITQIKWKDEEKEDFDITPTLQGCGRHHWLIDDDVITKLDCNADTKLSLGVAECASKNGWQIEILRWFGAQKLKISIYPSFKPINVDSVFVERTVQWDIDGKKHCVKSVCGCRTDFDVGLTFDDIQSITELIFEWKIVRVRDVNNQDIPVSDWLCNGIEVAENQ